jgi:hypothetical protein
MSDNKSDAASTTVEPNRKSLICLGHGYGPNLNRGKIQVVKERIYRMSYSAGIGLGHGRCFFILNMGYMNKKDDDSDSDCGN